MANVIPKTWGRVMLALVVVAAGLGAKVSMAEDVSMVELPIQGPLYMRATEQGKTIIISADGRFVMPGRLVDRANDHAMIMTVADAQAAFGAEPAVSRAAPRESASIDANGKIDPEALLKFTVGDPHGNKEHVFVWFDPICPHCHNVLAMQDQLTDRYVFHNVLVSVMGPQSENLVGQLACVNESERQKAVMDRALNIEPQGSCDDRGLQTNNQLASQLGITAVPVIVTSDRRMATGAPQTVEQLKAYLEGKDT